MAKTKRISNPQANCPSLDCYYNVDGCCHREGIHTNRKTCCCYIYEYDVK